MGSAIRPRGPYFRGMPCVSGSKTAGAPHSVMRGLRYLYSFARDACPGGSLELRLRQSCAALIDLRDFNPLRESATRQQSCSTSFPSYNEFKGEYRFTPFVSSQQLVRQISTAAPLQNHSGPPEDHPQQGKHAGPVSWVDCLPPGIVPYARLIRLHAPIGTWLLAWPCFWSIALAAPPGALPDAKLLALFGTGALLLRGAGCTVNDLWDRDLDAKVERTRSRPIASGQITPFQATAFLGAQLLLGLGILLQLNAYSIALGAASLGLVFTYPLLKRFTYWPQAYLGLTFNWGALLGWAAVQGSCSWPAILPLYASGICWTLVYDTIYAHQDKRDDVSAGVKSTALLFAERTKPVLATFAASQIALLGVTGYTTEAGVPFYASLVAAGVHLAWQIRCVDLDDRQDCMDKFVSNKWFGAVLFTGIVADKLLQ